MVQPLRVEQEERPQVRVEDGVVVIEDLLEDDPGVVALAAAATDPEQAIRACLQIGARASTAAGASLDALVVEKAFDGLVDGFSTTVGDAVTRIVGTAEGLVDEDSGPLPMMLSELKRELTTQLDALFDPDSNPRPWRVWRRSSSMQPPFRLSRCEPFSTRPTKRARSGSGRPRSRHGP